MAVDNDTVEAAGIDGRNGLVIVIGDWYFDEHWLMSRQKLYQSTQPGDFHYMTRHQNPEQQNNSFGGAACVYELLLRNSVLKNRLVGFGVWNPGDNEAVRCVLCPKRIKEKLLTPFTLTGLGKPTKTKAKKSKGPTIRKCSYNKRIACFMDTHNHEMINLTNSKNTSTNHIFRCYEGVGGVTPELRYRFDWILPRPKELQLTNLTKPPVNVPLGTAEAVVIVDHGLGTIDDKTIEALNKYIGPKTNVFIRTKSKKPAWMQDIAYLEDAEDPESWRKKEIEATIIDYRIANHEKGERRWSYKDTPGRAALEMLGELTFEKNFGGGKHNLDKPYPVVKGSALLLKENTVLAKYGETCYQIPHSKTERQALNFNRTTVFFAGLIAQYLRDPRERTKFDTKCARALAKAYQWSEKISKSWEETEGLNFCEMYVGAISKVCTYQCKKYNKDNESPYGPGIYTDLWARWNESSHDLGLTETTSKSKSPTEPTQKVLQLWRGEGTVPGFVCVGGPKRDSVNKLATALGAYASNPKPKRQLSCLFTGNPGWGKSFLADCLAKKFDMLFLEFSVAQMATKQEFVNCFANISSYQNRTNKRLLIFIDEINADIDNSSAISLLLGPLWGGSFTYDGKSYRLEPAAWIFASTQEAKELKKDKESKGSDFISRLNGPIVKLDEFGGGEDLKTAISTMKEELFPKYDGSFTAYKELCEDKSFIAYQEAKAAIKVEQVYLMVNLLSKYCGPINKVETSVLRLFRGMYPVTGIRSMEIFASKFRGITRGEVRRHNVPNLEENEGLRRHILVPSEWLKKREQYVAIQEDDCEFTHIEPVPQ